MRNLLILCIAIPTLLAQKPGGMAGVGGGGSAAPSGVAAGDLSGTYPNPTVVKINGTALSGLATGLLKNTTATGIPSIAVAGTDYAVATNGTNGQALTSNGAGGFGTALTLGTGVSAFLTTPSSANLATAVTDETGSGPLVFATVPTFTSRINLGGSTASFSAIKGNATGAEIKLADDSAYTFVRSSSFAATTTGGSDQNIFNNSGVGLGSTSIYKFTTSTNGGGTVDTGLSRVSAGVTGIGTGASGSFAGNLKLTPGTTTAGDVPVCMPTGGAGIMSFAAVTCGTSLRSAKDAIQPLDHGLDWLMKMKPSAFKWKFNGADDIGFIADDVAGIDKRLGAYDKGQLQNFKDRAVIAVLVSAVQEQQGQIRVMWGCMAVLAIFCGLLAIRVEVVACKAVAKQ